MSDLLVRVRESPISDAHEEITDDVVSCMLGRFPGVHFLGEMHFVLLEKGRPVAADVFCAQIERGEICSHDTSREGRRVPS